MAERDWTERLTYTSCRERRQDIAACAHRVDPGAGALLPGLRDGGRPVNALPFSPLRVVAVLPEAVLTARAGADCEPCWGLECALPFLIPALRPAGADAGWADTV